MTATTLDQLPYAERTLISLGKVPCGWTAKRADDRRKHRPRIRVEPAATLPVRRALALQPQTVRVHTSGVELRRKHNPDLHAPIEPILSPLTLVLGWLAAMVGVTLPRVPSVKTVRLAVRARHHARNDWLASQADPERLARWIAYVHRHPYVVHGVAGAWIRRGALVWATGALGAVNTFTGAVSGTWGTAGNWTDGVPTADDDVVLDATSPACTMNTNPGRCRSLDFLGYTNTFTHDSGRAIEIGDGTAGAGNRALRLVAGMTYALGSPTTSAISFVSTNATVQTVTWAGKTHGNLNFNGPGGSWQYQDGDSSPGVIVTFTAGTLDLNGQTCSWSAFTGSGGGTRILTPGAANITLQSASPWNWTTVAGLTVTANTATVTITGGTANGFTSGAVDWNGLSVVYTGPNSPFVNATGAFTVANLTRTGTATKTDGLSITGPFTVTGTLTLAGNSATNRLLVFSSVRGTARTITCNTTVAASNVDLMDITGAGTASWDLSAASGGSGDCQGNSGITFTAPATQTWTAGASTWSTAANWTSRVPLPQDNVVVGAGASGTVTVDMPRIGKDLDFTGCTQTVTFTGATTLESYGSITLGAATTPSQTTVWMLAGRGSHTITSNGRTFTQPHAVNGPGGTYSLADAYINSRALSSALTCTVGTFDTTNKAMTFTAGGINVNGGTFLAGSSAITLSSGGVSAIFTCSSGTATLGTSTWLLSTSAATPWNVSVGSTLTHSGTITIADAQASTRTFAGAGKTYGTLTYTVAGSTGALTITGNNTWAGGGINFSDASNARTLTLTGTTQTFTGTATLNVQGSVAGNMSVTGGTVTKSGLVNVDRVTLTNSTAVGGPWVAQNSVDGGGNTGWFIFSGGGGLGGGGGTFILQRRRR